LTDEWHGHLRPGYTSEGLREILGPAFVIDEAKTYSRAFSELIDTVLNGLYLKLQRRKGESSGSSKGAVITNADLRRHRKQFLLLSLLYPVIWSIARLDRLLWLQAGYKLIVQARRLGWPPGAGERHG
jgi:hypothetical protein